MRSLAGLAIVLCTAGVAGAQTLSDSSWRVQAEVLQDPSSDPISNLLDRGGFQPGPGLTDWSTRSLVVGAAADGSVVDLLHVRVGSRQRPPGGLPVDPNRMERDAKAYDVMLTRDWPDAVNIANDRYDLRVTPHAGLGVSNLGGSAEAGALVTLGPKSGTDRVAQELGRLGVRDGSSLDDTGRWYLFAAASGRAVGLNMVMKDAAFGWDRSWSQDRASTLIGDAQVGVAWRKGAVQTSLGYIHREVKGDHMLWGQETRDDSLVAFSLSVKPRR